LGLKGHLEIASRPFNDGRVEEQIKVIKEKVSIAESGQVAAKQSLGYWQHRIQIGTAPNEEVYQAQKALAPMASSYEDAILAADKIELHVKDARDRLRLSQEQLEREQAFLEDMTKRMTVASAVAGSFFAHVLEGAFVRKGHLLGEIEI
jgi:hypothetical protein